MVLLISILVALVGCQLQTELLAEKGNVAKKVTEKLDDDGMLQLIYDGSKGVYVVLRSTGNVQYNAFVRNKKATIQFTISDENDDDDLEEFIYYLKEESTYDTIQVFINDKEVPFNVVTAL